MKNDLPEKYKGNLFSRIKNFFKKFLRVEKNEIQKENIIVKDSANNFIEELKSSMGQEITNNQIVFSCQNKKFLLDLARHPEVLEKFSIEKLEIILNAYILENNKSKV